MDSLKNKEKKKHLTTRELRGKEELQSVMENKGKEFQDRRVRCYEKLQQGWKVFKEFDNQMENL